MPCSHAIYSAVAALGALAAAAVAGEKLSIDATPRYYYYDLATHESMPSGGIAWDPEVAWDNSAPTTRNRNCTSRTWWSWPQSGVRW